MVEKLTDEEAQKLFEDMLNSESGTEKIIEAAIHPILHNLHFSVNMRILQQIKCHCGTEGPTEWIRKQGRKGMERFVKDMTKRIENKILEGIL
jgi:hypothetical protein